MENEGVVRTVQNLHQEGFQIGLIVTDRLRQIAKWVR